MIDIHSHVLYGIDDGAQDIEESAAILREAEKAGITKLMLTPHFTIGEDVEQFIKKRDAKVKKLREAAEDEGIAIKIKAGAEVYITDEIFNEDRLDALCLGDSKVMLSEFKYHGVRSRDFIEYIEEIQRHGITPLVAHPERYSYLRNDRMLLRAVLDRGALLQVNGISLFEDSEDGDFARFLTEEGLAYAIGSDMHHIGSKRMAAMAELKRLGRSRIIKMTEDNPEKIFEGKGADENV